MGSFAKKLEQMDRERNAQKMEAGNEKLCKLCITIGTLEERKTANNERVLVVDIHALTGDDKVLTLSKLVPKSEFIMRGQTKADARRLMALEGVVAIIKEIIKEC